MTTVVGAEEVGATHPFFFLRNIAMSRSLTLVENVVRLYPLSEFTCETVEKVAHLLELAGELNEERVFELLPHTICLST